MKLVILTAEIAERRRDKEYNFAVIYKAQVNPHSGLRVFGLNPGNCLSALGTVGTAATMNRCLATHLLFIIELMLPSPAVAVSTEP